MKKNFEVCFKVTFEGMIVVEAENVQAAAKRVKSELGTNCCIDGDDALEVQSYIHVHTVKPEGEEL